MSRPTLSRVVEDRVLAGVVGGIARRFGWNPFWTRVGFVLVTALLAGLPGIFVYLGLWVLMPEGEA